MHAARSPENASSAPGVTVSRTRVESTLSWFFCLPRVCRTCAACCHDQSANIQAWWTNLFLAESKDFMINRIRLTFEDLKRDKCEPTNSLHRKRMFLNNYSHTTFFPQWINVIYTSKIVYIQVSLEKEIYFNFSTKVVRRISIHISIIEHSIHKILKLRLPTNAFCTIFFV